MVVVALTVMGVEEVAVVAWAEAEEHGAVELDRRWSPRSTW